MEEQKPKTPLRKAVDYLISIGKLTQDKDLAEKYDKTQGTISLYLSGTPGKEFVRNFERDFDINLKDFEGDGVPDFRTKPLDASLSMQAILNLTESNKKLADAHLRLTAMLESRNSTAVAQQQIPEAVSSMIAGLQEAVMRIATGERFATTNEVAALLYKVSPDQIPRVSAKDTQKG